MNAAEDVADLGPQDTGSDSDEDSRAQEDHVDTEVEATQVDEPVTPPRTTAQPRPNSGGSPSRISNGMSPEQTARDEDDDELTPLASPTGGRPSSADGSFSTPDDTPSVQVSYTRR
jgi:hypothetical protein